MDTERAIKIGRSPGREHRTKLNLVERTAVSGLEVSNLI